jgi:hypothetical protein
MSANRVYLLHPGLLYLPGIVSWIGEVRVLLNDLPDWKGWDLLTIQYNEANSFDVQPLFVRVLNKRGPVLLLEKVQSRPLALIREKLETRAIVLVRTIADSTELWAAVEECRERHEAGEPVLPRKLAVAVLIVRKLRHGHYWAGNAKGYLWHFDLAKGRGVDERFGDIAAEVANDLFLHEILVKKTSQRQQKLALNPDKKAEIHAIADDAIFHNKHLHEVLLRDHREEPASILYVPYNAQKFTIRADDGPVHECGTVRDAIMHAKGCPDGARYEVKIHLDHGKIWVESFVEKRLLVMFCEGFL